MGLGSSVTHPLLGCSALKYCLKSLFHKTAEGRLRFYIPGMPLVLPGDAAGAFVLGMTSV